MPNTDPQAVAQAIEQSVDADALMRALLDQYGAQAPLHWDVGASKMLVMRAGWNAARSPGDYLWISHRA